MHDPTSGSASAGDSHDQGSELQKQDNSKGKGPDPQLYTSAQLSQLKVPRRDRPDVASETVNERVLNTHQNPDLPRSQLSGVDNINSASGAGATPRTLSAHQRMELPRAQLPHSQLNGSQLDDSQLHGGLHSDNQLSAVDNVKPSSKVNAIGSTLDTHPGVELPQTKLPHNQLSLIRPYGGHLAVVDKANSASRANALITALNSHQRAEVLPRTQLSRTQLPSNRLLGSQSPVVDDVDYACRTSTTRSIVRKRRDFYNTKAGDSGIVQQPKRYCPPEAHPNPGKILREESLSTEEASGQLGSDLNQIHSASSGPDTLTVKPLNIIKKGGLQQFAANPPQALLPPLPTQRQSSFSNAEVSSVASTYGDTASLLNLSVHEEANANESGASGDNSILEPVEHKASLFGGTGNVQSSTRSSNELLTPPYERRIPPTSTLNTSNRSSGRISIVDSNGSMHSRPLSVDEAGALERHIKAVVRRMVCVSLDSSHSSILVPDEEAQFGSDRDDQSLSRSAELMLDLGPGGSQSASSHGPLSHSPTLQPDEESLEILSVYRSSGCSSAGAAAMNMWTDLCDAESVSSPVGRTEAIGSCGEGRIIGEMSEEGGFVVNPETIEENRRIQRQTHLYTLARLTGSSVVGFSSSVEGSDDEGAERTLSSQRGERRRYNESSRLERDEQSGNLILRPEYTFTAGAGFAHGDPSTPSQANLSFNNPYQHPTPLSRDHVHPFRSSPPVINYAGTSQHSYTHSYYYQTSDGSLPMDDEDYVLKPDTYTGQHAYVRADTYSNADRNFRTDTYSTPDLRLQPNTYPRLGQYSRIMYSHRRRGAYQSEVDESLASWSTSNDDLMRYCRRESGFVSSPTANALERFYAASSGVRNRDEGFESKEYADFIEHNSSLVQTRARQAKPEVNHHTLTTLDHIHTHSHTNRLQPYLTSAPTQHTSSHRRVGANRPQLYQPYRETSWNFSSRREYGITHDMLREHRRQLAAASLLPRAFTPPTPTRHLTSLHLATLTFSSTPSGGSSIRAVGPAGPSGGPTSLPPLCGGAQSERRRFVPAPHLIPNRRPSAAVLNRQRTLGAAIIAVMGVCPPLLLIVGLGGMDPTMTSVMRGEVAGFTEAQKKVALGLGVGGSLGVLLGAIGAIIYLVLHH